MENNQVVKKENGVNLILLIVVILLVAVVAFMAGMLLKNNGTTGKSNVLSDEEALQIGTELYAKGYEIFGSIFDEEEYEDGVPEADCKAKYTEFQKIFTEKSIKTYEGRFKDENGKWLCFAGAGRGGNVEYMDETELIIKKKEENKIIFKKEVKYCEDADYDDDENCVSKERTEERKFIIEKENGAWKISKIEKTH